MVAAGLAKARGRGWRGGCSMAVLASVLAACAPPPPPPAAPAAFPEAYYREAERRGETVLAVDSGRSRVTIAVHRAGSMARLGHDHVVASHDLRGYVTPAAGRADLYVPLERLAVDEPRQLAEAGFATELSAAAVAGTRRNMLEKVLDAEHHPFALIHATRADADATTLSVALTLRGKTRVFPVPVDIARQGEGIVVSGRLAFKQSDFGIAPLSVLGGAIQVQDRVDLRFRIVAGGR